MYDISGTEISKEERASGELSELVGIITMDNNNEIMIDAPKRQQPLPLLIW